MDARPGPGSQGAHSQAQLVLQLAMRRRPPGVVVQALCWATGNLKSTHKHHRRSKFVRFYSGCALFEHTSSPHARRFLEAMGPEALRLVLGRGLPALRRGVAEATRWGSRFVRKHWQFP